MTIHTSNFIRSFSAIALFILSSAYCNGQILKINKGSILADSSDFFMGSVQLDFNANNRSATKNRDVVFKGFTANGDLVYVAKNHAFLLINKVNYFSSTGGPFISTGYAHFRVNFMRKRPLSFESFSQAQYDDGRSMPFRFLQGVGIRLRLVQSEKSSLHFGIGGMFERERWRPLEDGLPEVQKNLWKTANYINAKLRFNDIVALNSIVYYQAGYDDEPGVFRNRISGDASLSVKLTNTLSFSTNFTAQYEDKPIIDINEFVYSVTNGLRFNF